MYCTLRPMQNVRHSIRRDSPHRLVAADFEVVRRYGAPTVRPIRLGYRWARSVLYVRRICPVCTGWHHNPTTLSQLVHSVGDRHHVKQASHRNDWRRRFFSVRIVPLSNRLGCCGVVSVPDALLSESTPPTNPADFPCPSFVADLSLALTNSYDCGKGAGGLSVPRSHERRPKETRSMTRNPKAPAARQQLLFFQAAQRPLELPIDKQRELQTAVADLLLNALTGHDLIDSGETDDEPQAHA
jgi:hypothetical protein